MSPIVEAVRDLRDAARAFSRPARLYLLTELLAWTGLGIHQVLFNLYLVEAGFDAAFVGRAVSISAAGLALAALPSGWLADRWGRRPCSLLGALLDGTALLLRSSVADPWAIYAGSFLTGIGHALLAIVAAPFLTEHSTSRERTHLFSAFFAVSLLAGVIGSLLGGWIPAGLVRLPEGLAPDTFVAYRITLVLAALIGFASALPVLAMGRLPEPITARDVARVRPEERRMLVPIAVNAFLIGAGAGLVIPFMNLYFKTRFDCSSAQIGGFFAVAQVITALAALLGPAVARRFGKLRTAVASELLSLPFLVTLGFERHLEIAVIAFWLRATLMQAATPLHSAFIMEALPPALRARSSSLNNMVWNAGWAVSATFAGVLIQRFGHDVPFYVTAVLYAGAATYFYLSFRHVREVATPIAPLTDVSAASRGDGTTPGG